MHNAFIEKRHTLYSSATNVTNATAYLDFRSLKLIHNCSAFTHYVCLFDPSRKERNEKKKYHNKNAAKTST